MLNRNIIHRKKSHSSSEMEEQVQGNEKKLFNFSLRFEFNAVREFNADLFCLISVFLSLASPWFFISNYLEVNLFIEVKNDAVEMSVRSSLLAVSPHEYSWVVWIMEIRCPDLNCLPTICLNLNCLFGPRTLALHKLVRD